MVETHGLTHVALAVRDLERSSRFYRELLGAVVVYQDEGTVQLQTPGNWDVIVLERNPMAAGRTGGVRHFGFRLKRAEDIEAAVAAVEAAGGRVERTGEFVPGEPYVFAADPDGYEVELWYELPTPVDPPSRPRLVLEHDIQNTFDAAPLVGLHCAPLMNQRGGSGLEPTRE